jgi:hypothetical protein
LTEDEVRDIAGADYAQILSGGAPAVQALNVFIQDTIAPASTGRDERGWHRH